MLCLRVKDLHESTKTCMFPCIFPFSAHLSPHYIIMTILVILESSLRRLHYND